MEAILDGTPQFIVASINALITSSQAGYLNRLDDMFHGKSPPKLPVRVQWHMLLAGWWILTVTTIVTVFRIGFGAMSSYDATDSAFVRLDLAIVSLMGLGYCWIAVVALLAWRIPGPWAKTPWRTVASTASKGGQSDRG